MNDVIKLIIKGMQYLKNVNKRFSCLFVGVEFQYNHTFYLTRILTSYQILPY